MKFIHTLTAVALATSTFAPLGYAQQASVQVGQHSVTFQSQDSQEQQNAKVYAEEIGKWKLALVSENAALTQAINDKNSQVHFSQDLFKFIGVAGGLGFIGHMIYKDEDVRAGFRNVASLFRRTSEAIDPASEVAEESRGLSARAAAAAEATPAFLKVALEGVAFTALLFLTIDEAKAVGHSYNVRFHDTEEIKALNAKIHEAQINLDSAEANLKALYATPDTRT